MTKVILLLFHINLIYTLPNPENFYLKSTSLPIDLSYMPSLSNGHLGLTVYGDSIYTNGIYNGHGGNSRRARLPNFLNISVDSILDENDRLYTKISSEYGLNLKCGYFEVQENFIAYNTTSTENITIMHRYYAHRYFNRALIYDLHVKRTNIKENIRLILSQKSGNISEDFNLKQIYRKHSNWIIFEATTRELENKVYQKTPLKIYFILNDNFIAAPTNNNININHNKNNNNNKNNTSNNNNNKILYMSKGQSSYQYRFIITIDPELSTAVNEMEQVENLSSIDLLHAHINEWLKFWQEFHIEIKGNLELSQIINAGIFYMATSLPSKNTYQPNLLYYGLSPTGLSRGSLDRDYQGHNFWDTEIWMLPVITQMNINWTLELFEYRFNHLSAASYNANITGFKGARYPWESAYTGTEVTNPCCPDVAQMEVHISADIIFAIRQFYAVTENQIWLCHKAWPLIYAISEFLVDRVTYNATLDQYHIKDVMGPDEDHAPVTDNVYTNVLFKLALNFSSYTLLKCQDNSTDNQLLNEKWLNVAEKLYVLYDAKQDYHPEYDGYTPDILVKQADAILLGYPLQYSMNRTTKSNDLITYEKAIRKSGPAMTWSMFTINYLDVNNKQKADQYFLKSYEMYIHPEFKVWSEVEIGFNGSANFLTGIGGFLQTLLYGYSGIRYHLNANKSVMIIKRRCVPSFMDGLTITGLKFHDSVFSLEILAANYSTLKCLHIGNNPLILKREVKNENYFIPLTSNCLIEFGSETITIQSV